MAKKILLGVVFLLVLVLAFAAARPDSFHVERSISIKAPPEKIFPLLNDFHQFGIWSPWEKIDPAMQRTYSGPAMGLGAVYAWEGNSEVGAGRMEILQSVPNNKVVIKLDFLKPFESNNTAEYSLQTVGDSTTMTWSMNGPSPYMTKLMTMFVSMDSMVGGDFERGLATLKAVAEK